LKLVSAADKVTRSSLLVLVLCMIRSLSEFGRASESGNGTVDHAAQVGVDVFGPVHGGEALFGLFDDGWVLAERSQSKDGRPE